MGFNDVVYLLDVESVQDVNNGTRKLRVIGETKVYADIQEVGMNEFYQATMVEQKLSASIEIAEDKYKGQRYIVDKNAKKVYCVTRVGKGRNKGYLRLPVEEVLDEQIIKKCLPIA